MRNVKAGTLPVTNREAEIQAIAHIITITIG